MFKHLPKAQTEIQQKEKAPAVQRKSNQTGIPDPIKNRFEAGSGFSFDDVRVHYNSVKPAQLHALAYTQGSQVFVAPGQEKHLPHELGHVVQQKQGIVHPTTVVNGVSINDSQALERSADAIQFKSDTENRAVSSGQSGDIIQMRADNPYSDSSGLTGHHIIPHSLLVKMLGKLSPNDQTAVKTRAVPNLTDITLRQLHNMKIIQIGGVGIQVRNRFLSFGKLKSAYKLNEAKAKANHVPAQGNFFLDLPIGPRLLRDINTLIESDETRISLDNQTILNSFFEWQAGNQFVAMKDRAEPGKSDEFDSDSKYVYGEEHVGRLKTEYDALKALDNQGALPADIKEALERVIDISTKKSVPASYNPKQWVKIDAISDYQFKILAKRYLQEDIIGVERINNLSTNHKIPFEFSKKMVEKIEMFSTLDHIAMRNLQQTIKQVQEATDAAAVANDTAQALAGVAALKSIYVPFLSTEGLKVFLPALNPQTQKFDDWIADWNTFQSAVTNLCLSAKKANAEATEVDELEQRLAEAKKVMKEDASEKSKARKKSYLRAQIKVRFNQSKRDLGIDRKEVETLQKQLAEAKEKEASRLK